MNSSLIIGFEGIDGSGTSTQVHELTQGIENLDKYQDVLRTHEPWKNSEIKRKLEEDGDAYSDPEETAQLFVGDRTDHSYRLIDPLLSAGAIVISSRYKASTCAFQWAQGVSLEKLLRMHENRGILTPDAVFFLDTSQEVAASRMKNREKKEKFEGNAEFIDKVIGNYRKFAKISKEYPSLFGPIIKIDGNMLIEEVAEEVYRNFLPIYNKKYGTTNNHGGILYVRKKSKPPINEMIKGITKIL